MKKNYIMPQIEVSEMMANAILAASGTTGFSGGDPDTSVSGSTAGVGGIQVGAGTMQPGASGGAKASNHLEF